MANRREKVEAVADFIFLNSKITVASDCIHEIKRHLLFGKKVMTNLDSLLKTRAIILLTIICIVKAIVFPIVMYGCELNHEEGWVLKNWCFWILVLEKTHHSSLDCKKIKPINPKGNQPWTFTGRTDAEAEAPILWSPDAERQHFGKDPDAKKD